MKVMAFKLMSGEEIIARVAGDFDPTAEVFELDKSMSIQVGERNGKAALMLMPYVTSNQDATISLLQKAVIAVIEPDERFEKQYLNQTSGIQLV